MRSLQNYIDIYRSIASNNNLVGDSVEMLVQMLAQASYISEVENVSYVQEASLEKAKLMNSKIQRCMDDMYSVFRGTCPRVILNVRPKAYFTFNMFDEIVKSNSFKVYFLGQYTGETVIDKNSQVATLEGFKYGTVTLSPSDTPVQILGFIASETSDRIWQATKSSNYYLDNTDNFLSNDMWVKVGNVGEDGKLIDSTTNFSDHIMEGKIFDLTLPSFGSRLYVANVLREGGAPENTIVQARYYKYSTLSNYPNAELKKISIKGTDLVAFSVSEAGKFSLDNRRLVSSTTKEAASESGSAKSFSDNKEIAPGILLIDSNNRDTISTVHYKASRDRYVNSLLRSNSDIRELLENMYPNKIAQEGTNYEFNTDSKKLFVYYAPKNTYNLLTTEEINQYKKRAAFYTTSEIVVKPGTVYTAIFNIDLELYQVTSVDSEVKPILDSYGKKFGMNFSEDEKINEIKSLISKISNVKNILNFSIDYINAAGGVVSASDIYGANDNPAERYFNISMSINSTINTNS